MIFGRKRIQKNDMDEDFEEYDEEYAEGEEDFEVHKPMHKIKRERDRTLNNPRNNHRVNLRKYRGRGWGCSHKKGLPKREKSTPINRTHGKSPFTYASGLQLHRGSKSEESEEYPEKKCKSWGVPWK